MLGIVGLGRIGRHVASRAQALGMRILATDPLVDDPTAEDLNVEMVALDDLLAAADIVTLHLPLDRETHHIIDRHALSLMRRGSRLINCARGGLVDEAALLEALDAGHLAGAACDVFESEPDPRPELLAHPCFVGTPHLGGATVEAHRRVDEDIARQVAAYLRENATG